MNTPKSAPTAHTNNVELYKTANKTASFIAEAMLDFAVTDGKTYNKIVFVIVKRDAQNKAEATVRYFLDIAPSKVLFHDLWHDTLSDEHNEFKQRGNVTRALKITQNGDGYRISVMNAEHGDKAWLFFDLSQFQVRCLARTVLDHLHCYELAMAIQQLSADLTDETEIDNPLRTTRSQHDHRFKQASLE